MFSLLFLAALATARQTQIEIKEQGEAYVRFNDKCTAFINDPKASVDGATMTTHTNDCYNCDFRLARVPAQDFPPGSKKAIYLYRIAYPRYVGYDRGEVYWPQNTEGAYPWNITEPIGYIDQVPHTYAYLEGTYGLINEYQVAMGESTCSAKIFSTPAGHGGDALMEIGVLSRLAMERCQTARCAIKLMGELAETYGFYGSNWVGSNFERMLEAGEAMTVSDPTEAWVFHILPDPTGKSAVWAAQKLQDGHFAIVANEFIIKEINLEDPSYYLASANIYEVAINQKLWDPTTGPFNFQKAFMAGHPFKRYVQRRQWRGLDFVAPSLKLDGETPLEDLPFSVKVDKLVSKEDFFTLLRDHYEGTPYDMTQGLSAGPYGNPNRYDMGTGSGVPIDVIYKGSFERAISIFRAQYSYVTMSRANLPNDIGGMMWFGHYAPHATVFVPFYVSSELPIEYQVGSLYKLNRKSSYWAFCVIGNWLEKHYKFIIVDIQKKQKELETLGSQQQVEVEAKALELYKKHDIGAARAILSEWTIPLARSIVAHAWDFLDYLIVRYHDGYMFADLEAEFLNPTKLFYPFWWLEQVGFFDPLGSRVPAYMNHTPDQLNVSLPSDRTNPDSIVSIHHEEHNYLNTEQPTPKPTVSPATRVETFAKPESRPIQFSNYAASITPVASSNFFFHLNFMGIVSLLLTYCVVFALGIYIGKYRSKRSEYQPLDEE